LIPAEPLPPPPRLRCLRAELSALSADATSPFWREIEAVALRDTISGAVPQQETSVRVAWNAEELRILFHAEDAHISATLTEHDAALYTEEVVEFFLDPVGDLGCYFEIEVNPLNAILDLILRRNRSGYRKDFSWDCADLRTRVRCEAAAWSAELSIPFTSLNGQLPAAGSEWRANFARIDRPPGVERELSAWSPTHLATFHVPERFGVLQFVASR
jgi:hypothetical protein